MIDLKLPKKSKKEREKGMMVEEPMQDKYPWGTRLSFEKEQINKIKALQGVDVGDKVQIQAVGKVIEISASDSEGGRGHKRVEIQVQKISINTPSEEKKAFEED